MNETHFTIPKRWIYGAIVAFAVPFITGVVYVVTLWNDVGNLQDNKTGKIETAQISERVTNITRRLEELKLDSLVGRLGTLENAQDGIKEEWKVTSAGLKAAVDRLPPGTVVASVLKPQVFLRNGRNKKWRLSDASVIPPDSLYAMLVKEAGIEGGDRLPDLRGMFLRGLNVGREDGRGDPDGVDRKAGEFQGGATKRPNRSFVGNTGMAGRHTHTIEGAEPVLTGTEEDFQRNKRSRETETAPEGRHYHTVEITGGGDAETRPGNISVYFYIKIN